MKANPDLRQAVLRELEWDARVREAKLGVEVDEHVVTLTGTVDSWGKRLAAQEAAHRVEGVLDVANDIQVELPHANGRTDTALAQAIRHALEWDVFVPESRIRSTVSDGWVTLEGDVESLSQRDDAENAVRNLAGVRVVINRIDIKPSVFTGDIRSSISSALERHAERAARHISIDVLDGRVSLTGEVASRAEKDAVLGAAKGTHGVRMIEDHLRIDDPSQH